MQTLTPSAAAAPARPLALWLRLLWGCAPALHLDSEWPFIGSDGIHLPAQPVWQQHCAAAAHAAAHLVYSPAGLDATGLVPIARNLLALLEDARVEALAMRELPGLAKLWRPLHTVSPDDGNGCEALMGRLARALVDPAYADPDPWVAKGRRLFYMDEHLGLLALRTPAELRAAALRLGHDIGQRRLPFNHRGYRPSPAYRDDHRWMWAADQLASVQPPPQPTPTPTAAPPPPGAQHALAETLDVAAEATAHPEWDRLIRRLRRDWARVVESASDRQPAAPDALEDPAARALARRVVGPLRGLSWQQGGRGRSADGEVFDLDALVRGRMAWRVGVVADPRVYRKPRRQAARTPVCVLVDQSASTGLQSPQAGQSLLHLAAEAAAATAAALQFLGLPCLVAAFGSQGRQAVQWRCVKAWSEAVDAQLPGRIRGLGSVGSTRLGAALRHAVMRLAQGRRDTRARAWVLLLSDGEPHDVDVHDPLYLVEDARQAVREGLRRGVRMACLHLGAAPAAQAQHIFGRSGVQALPGSSALPAALQRLLR